MKRELRPAARTFAVPATLKPLLCAAVVSALGALAPAQAEVITFDSVTNIVSGTLQAGDTAYNTGDAFTQGGYQFRANNSATADPSDYGLVGALVDSDNAYACLITGCPNGTGSTYYAGLNDGSLTVTGAGPLGFTVTGLKYAFMAPLDGLADFSYGRLLLTGITSTGASLSTGGDFAGQGANNRFDFADFLFDAGFASTAFTSLTISACLFNSAGACVDVHELTRNQAQFAIDDLVLNAAAAAVPEPGSIALLLMGMAGLGAATRRRVL